MKPKVMQRQELFELVWSKSMPKLAKELGTRVETLRSACIKHEIPAPGSGHWAKVAAGKKTRKAKPLPAPSHPDLERVIFRIGLAALPAEISQLATDNRRERKVRSIFREAGQDTPPRPSPKRRRFMDEVARDLRYTLDKDDVTRIRREYGIIRVGAKSIRRVTELAAVIADGLEPLGVQMEWANLTLIAVGEGARIHFSVEEATDPVEVKRRLPPPPPVSREEFARAKAVEMLEKRRWRRDHLNVPYPRRPPPKTFYHEVVHKLNGKLTIKLDTPYIGLRQSWTESERDELEHLVPDIVAAMHLHLKNEGIRLAEAAEEKRRHDDLIRRQNLAKARTEREEKRVKFLRGLGATEQEARALRDQLRDLEKTAGDRDGELGRLLAWARLRLEKLERRLEPEAIAAAIKQQSLFPEPDDLHDPLGEPPSPKPPWA